MTGNLQMLMQLHDERVAEDVREMAELGYFDTEFTMYGCAYLDKGQRYYKISPNAADIYCFIEESHLHDVFPSNVCQYTKSCAVPAGMKEVIAQDVKVELAKQLSDLFPREFLVMLQQLAEQVTTNGANEFLLEKRDALEGLFDIEQLRRFEELLNYMYSCRKVTSEEFSRFHLWLKEERKSMMENFETKDIFEKTMYGAMYFDGDRKKRYVENARLEYVYEKVYALEQQGGVVTPVFAKTFWYNYRYRLADVMQDYKKMLRFTFDEEYLNKLETIRRTDLFKTLFAENVEKVRECYSEKAVETLLRYGNRWGVYRV